MSALGLIFIGFGLLTAWSGFNRTIVFDVIRSAIGAPIQSRTTAGKPDTTTTTAA